MEVNIEKFAEYTHTNAGRDKPMNHSGLFKRLAGLQLFAVSNTLPDDVFMRLLNHVSKIRAFVVFLEDGEATERRNDYVRMIKVYHPHTERVDLLVDVPRLEMKEIIRFVISDESYTEEVVDKVEGV